MIRMTAQNGWGDIPGKHRPSSRKWSNARLAAKKAASSSQADLRTPAKTRGDDGPEGWRPNFASEGHMKRSGETGDLLVIVLEIGTMLKANLAGPAFPQDGQARHSERPEVVADPFPFNAQAARNVQAGRHRERIFNVHGMGFVALHGQDVRGPVPRVRDAATRIAGIA
ncbi:MAG: hypothetical protein U1F87_08830 [Kiritimatiellia bacterium]